MTVHLSWNHCNRGGNNNNNTRRAASFVVVVVVVVVAVTSLTKKTTRGHHRPRYPVEAGGQTHRCEGQQLREQSER
jgi:hypothetical protein